MKVDIFDGSITAQRSKIGVTCRARKLRRAAGTTFVTEYEKLLRQMV